MKGTPKIVSFERTGGYLHQRAMDNRREKRWLDAVELLRQAIERSPERKSYQIDLATTYTEMGLFEPSYRLLTHLMLQKDAPRECLLGLARNLMDQGDGMRARIYIDEYLEHCPDSASAKQMLAEAQQLDEPLPPEPQSRKERRVANQVEMASQALQDGEYARANRIIDHCLRLPTAPPSIRAFKAMALYRLKDMEGAEQQAEWSVAAPDAEEKIPMKALYAAAQVFHYLGRIEQRDALVRRALAARLEEEELRIRVNMLCAFQWHKEAMEDFQRLLSRHPYDRTALHALSIGAYNRGEDLATVRKGWSILVRIDPDDVVVQYYLNALDTGTLPPAPLPYAYSLPAEEFVARIKSVIDQVQFDLSEATRRWESDKSFRETLHWAITRSTEQMAHVALPILASIPGAEPLQRLKEYAARPDLSIAVRMFALELLEVRGLAKRQLGQLGITCMPSKAAYLTQFPVGQRQMLRCASEYMETQFGVEASLPLAIMWQKFMAHRGFHVNPVWRTESGAAGLIAFLLRTQSMSKFSIRSMAHALSTSPRQVRYILQCMSRTMEVIEADKGQWPEGDD